MEVDIILRNLIISYMGLGSNRVFVSGENINAPKDNNIWVVVTAGPVTVIGSKSYFDTDNLRDTQHATISRELTVDIASRSRDAQDRAHELALMIDSIKAQQVMEENQIRIFRAGSMLNLSPLEGPSALHRFQFPFIVNYSVEKTAVTGQYFDKSQPLEVVTNASFVAE